MLKFLRRVTLAFAELILGEDLVQPQVNVRLSPTFLFDGEGDDEDRLRVAGQLLADETEEALREREHRGPPPL